MKSPIKPKKKAQVKGVVIQPVKMYYLDGWSYSMFRLRSQEDVWTCYLNHELENDADKYIKEGANILVHGILKDQFEIAVQYYETKELSQGRLYKNELYLDYVKWRWDEGFRPTKEGWFPLEDCVCYKGEWKLKIDFLAEHFGPEILKKLYHVPIFHDKIKDGKELPFDKDSLRRYRIQRDKATEHLLRFLEGMETNPL